MASGKALDTCEYCGRRTGRSGHLCAAGILAGAKTVVKPRAPRERDARRYARLKQLKEDSKL